jgi:hypothetical protein
LGRLKKTASEAAPAASAGVERRPAFTAGGIANLLLSPDNVRNAIILGEILRRPDER